MHDDNLYQTLHVHTSIVDIDSLSRSWESLTKRDQNYVPFGMRVDVFVLLCFLFCSSECFFLHKSSFLVNCCQGGGVGGMWVDFVDVVFIFLLFI